MAGPGSLITISTTASSGGTSDHNSLTGLQGGAASTYYHSNQGINTSDSPYFTKLGVAISPTYPLDVLGRAVIGTKSSSRGSYGNTLTLANETAVDTSLFVWEYGVAGAHFGFSAGSNVLRITNSTSDGLLTNPNGIFIKSNGLIGIGTTDSDSSLQIAGTANTAKVKSDWGFDINPVVSPASISGTRSAGAGLEIGTYYYLITYITALGETNSFISAAITTTSGNQRVTLTIPVSTDSRVTSRKLYRTKVNTGAWQDFVLTTIANNTSTSYIDSTADASLTGSSGSSYFRLNTTSNYIMKNGVRSLMLDVNATSLGIQALPSLTTGGRHVGIGYQAGNSLTSANDCVAIGHSSSMYNVGGSSNVGVGAYSLRGVTGNSYTYNVAIGAYSLFSVTTGGSNTAVGYNSLYTLSNGPQNTAIGYGAGYTNNSSTGQNVFIGYSAGYYETGNNKLFIDNRNRSNEATGRTSALIYGVFDATPANQTLTINGVLTALNLSGTNTGDQFTATSASTLLGRGSASGVGAAQEITLGTNLSMSGTTLNVTGVISSHNSLSGLQGGTTGSYYHSNQAINTTDNVTFQTLTANGTISASNLSGTNTGDQFTSVSASKLIGRGSASGAGAAEEITLGTNLSMSGTTLNVSGVITDHNSLSGLQGGGDGDFYHSRYADGAKSVTLDELNALIAGNDLVPFQWYLVTDYQTYDYIRQTSAPKEWYTGAVEEIYLQASGVNTLFEEGWSKTFEDEKISYIATRPDVTENPYIEYTGGANDGSVDVSIVSDTQAELTSAFAVSPDDATNFSLYVLDVLSGAEHTFDSTDKGTNWEFDGDVFTLLNDQYPQYINYSVDYGYDYGNAGSEEISIISSSEFESSTPLSDFSTTDWTPENGAYWGVSDSLTGYSCYFDGINKGTTWDIVGGVVNLYNLGNEYGLDFNYDFTSTSNSGSYDIIDITSNSFAIDFDGELQKGEGANYGTSYFVIDWTDSTSSEFYWYDYGTKWELVSNEVVIYDTHDLTTDAVALYGNFIASSNTEIVDLTGDIYLYGNIYDQSLTTMVLSTACYMSGGWSYSFSLGGLITRRQIPAIDLDIDVDFRATKFRRYASDIATWSSIQAYSLGNIVKYSNSTYVCIRANLNKVPPSYNAQWLLLNQEDNISQNKWYGSGVISSSITSATEEGQVTQATIVAGGSGYTTGTVQIDVMGGSATCTLSCTASGGSIVSIDSVVTPGYGYVYSPSYPYNTTSTDPGYGCTVYINGLTSPQITMYQTPNKTSYTDGYILYDLLQINTCVGFKLKRYSSNAEIDFRCYSPTVIHSEVIQYPNTYVTINNLSNSKIKANGFLISHGGITNSNIEYSENLICRVGNRLNIQSITNSFLYFALNVQANYMNNTLVGQEGLSGVLAKNWNNVVLYSMVNCTANDLSVVTFNTQCRDNYFNKLNYVGQYATSTITYNLISGELRRVYFEYTMRNNVITSECFYLTSIKTGGFYDNQIYKVVGHEGLGGSGVSPVVVNTFAGNLIQGDMYSVVLPHSSMVNNQIQTQFIQVYARLKEASGNIQINNNRFYSGFYSHTFYDNKCSILGNTCYSYANGWTFQASGNQKTLDSCVFMAHATNLFFTQGVVNKSVFFGTFGIGGANYFNGASGSTVLITECTFMGTVYNNTYTGNMQNCVVGAAFSGNTLSQTIAYTTFGTNFASNTIGGNITRSTLRNNISSSAIPALTDRYYPDFYIKGTTTTTAYPFIVENGSATQLIKVRNDGTVGIGVSGSSTHPNSTLQIIGSFSTPFISKSTNYTLTDTDYGVGFTGAYTATLPTAVGKNGRWYFLKNISASDNLTVTTTSGQTIDGVTTVILLPWEGILVQSTNTNWIIA